MRMRVDHQAAVSALGKWSVCVVLVLLLCGCVASRVKHGKPPLRILPIGDSITVGYTDNPSWRAPFEFGYRAALLELLEGEGIQVQYVGDSLEPWNGLWKAPTNAPSPDLRLLGQDHHEGYGAKATAFVEQHIEEWIAKHEPDIVLLMIGINDIAAGSTNPPPTAMDRLRAIVRTIVTSRPHTHVIVAENIPYTRPTPALAEWNRFIRETLVPEFAAVGARVSSVDQCSNFTTTPGALQGERSLYSNGYNHPSGDAYRRMARTWFEGIQRVLKEERRTGSSNVQQEVAP